MTITKKQQTLLSDALNMVENKKIIYFQDLYDYVIDRLMSNQPTELNYLQTAKGKVASH